MRSIPYALLTLSAVFGFAVAWCLNQIWKLTFGAFFVWLGKKGIDVPLGLGRSVGVHPFGFLLKFNNEAQAFFSGMVATSEHAMVRLFHATVSSFGALADEIGALAQAVERKIVGVAAGTVPRLIRGALGAVWGQLKRIPKLASRIDDLYRYVERKVAHAISTALAFAYRQLRHAGQFASGLATSVWKLLKHYNHRLSHVERNVFAPLGLVHLHDLLRALKLGWLFASNVTRFNQWLILQHAGDIYEFVKDALSIFAETDLCKLAAYNYDVAVYVFEPMMMELVGLTDWFCQHENYTLPSACSPKPGYDGDWAPSATPSIIGPFKPKRLAPDVPLPVGVVRA